MRRKPQWLSLADELIWPIVGMGLASLQATKFDDPDIGMIPYLALLHMAHCLLSSMQVNESGRHSVAVCLVRQCVEALTVVDLGLQEGRFAVPLLESWRDSRITHGNLRMRLETTIWPRYGHGLWDESWAEYFANLAKSVQPYAHYTPPLQGWQFATVSSDVGRGGRQAIVMFGLQTYDPLKASRVTLLHSLVGWTLARLLLAHGRNDDVNARQGQIVAWGEAIGRSRLLFQRADWGSQLLPHMFFKEGVDWADDD